MRVRDRRWKYPETEIDRIPNSAGEGATVIECNRADGLNQSYL